MLKMEKCDKSLENGWKNVIFTSKIGGIL